MLEVESIGARIVADATQYVTTMTQTVPAAAQNAVNSVIAHTQQLRITSRLMIAEAAASATAIATTAVTAATAITVAASASAAGAILRIAAAAPAAASHLLRITSAGKEADAVLLRITQSATSAANAIASMRSPSNLRIGGPVGGGPPSGGNTEGPPGRGKPIFYQQPTPLRITSATQLTPRVALGSSWANAPSAGIMRQMSFAASNLTAKLSGVGTAAVGMATQYARMVPGGNTAIAMLSQIGLSAGPAAIAVVALGAALVGVGIGAWALNLAADAQSAQTRFKVMLHSATEAKELVASIRYLASTTPLVSGPLMNTAATLLNARVAAVEITHTLRMLGDLAGGNQEKLDGIALAYTQVKAKGRLMGQEAIQFTERGVPLWDALRDSMRKVDGQTQITDAQIRVMAENGEISFAMVRDALEGVVVEGGALHGNMADQAKDLHGRWSTLIDAMDEFGRSAGEGSIPLATDAVIYLTEVTQNATAAVVEMVKFWDRNEESIKRVASVAAIALNPTLALANKIKGMFSDPAADAAAAELMSRMEAMGAQALKNIEDNAVAKSRAAEALQVAADKQAEAEADKQDAIQKANAENVKAVQELSLLRAGASEAEIKDAVRLREFQEKHKLDADSPEVRALEATLTANREIVAQTKERIELEKEVADASKSIESQTIKAQQEVRALNAGWSEELARDVAILENLASKFGVASNDPRLQQLAQLMDKERELTAAAKARAEAEKEQKDAAKKMQDLMKSDADAINEKFMNPVEKMRREVAKLHQLRKVGLIDDRALKMALYDLKEIERQRNKMDIDLGLSAEQVQLMAAASLPSRPQGLAGAGPVDFFGEFANAQQGGNGNGNPPQLVNAPPGSQNTAEGREQAVAAAIIRMSDDTRRIFRIQDTLSQREEVVEIVELV